MARGDFARDTTWLMSETSLKLDLSADLDGDLVVAGGAVSTVELDDFFTLRDEVTVRGLAAALLDAGVRGLTVALLDAGVRGVTTGVRGLAMALVEQRIMSSGQP